MKPKLKVPFRDLRYVLIPTRPIKPGLVPNLVRPVSSRVRGLQDLLFSITRTTPPSASGFRLYQLPNGWSNSAGSCVHARPTNKIKSLAMIHASKFMFETAATPGDTRHSWYPNPATQQCRPASHRQPRRSHPQPLIISQPAPYAVLSIF